MATVNTSVVPSNSPTISTIFNVSALSASTEYSQVLPANTKRFIIKSRGNAVIQLANNTGQTNTNYITIPGGAVYENTNFYSSKTLYFEVDKADTVEIEAHV